MSVSTWPDISHLSVSRPELINVPRQMGQHVKWPQKMKAPDSLRNPGFWGDFHRDHGHKKKDCVALKIKVNELLKKGHLREFLSEKAKSHLSKETTGKPTEAAPVSPPRQDRVIHVISGGLEICGISHAAATKSTWNAKHSLEAAKPKRLLLRTDEISFMAKEQKKVLTPHHDSLVISLTVANCLVKRILVDNRSSGNIIFQAAYKDLGLEEGVLTRRVTPLIGTDEISFTTKEQEKVLTPHHDALVISLIVGKCLVKRILVDNGSSGNIIFQAAYKDLGLEEGTLTRRTTLKGKTKVI
ncbi:hypothetical protein F2Q69_00037719 [Brassica cretica]|uniref:Uncharacterized protein n=1 Tax=Brassica cretica TaxID=69181 RepID=A0A8S9SJH0_BRACR|nr:hypothetical protein F2Q69_00037719 [Brassica cretica]